MTRTSAHLAIHRWLPLALVLAAQVVSGQTPDTTPPTLEVTHSWIRKESGFYVFRMLLDPRDDRGIQKLEYREKINTTSIPSSTPWSDAFQNGIDYYGVPWRVNEPFELAFNCTSLVVQFRAVDTSGNVSGVITQTFKAPFPLSNTPNLDPKVLSTTQNNGPAMDCRGLFSADFDGNGLVDVAQVDRATGVVKVRRNMGGFSTSNGFSLAANTIEDSASADLDGDGRPDLAIAHGGAFTLYHNDGLDGNGTLQFSGQTPPEVAQLQSGLSAIHQVGAGDVSGDGRPDLILAGEADDGMGGTVARVTVLHANASGGFVSPSHGYSFPATQGAGRLAVGDVNNDGFPDIVTISAVSKQLVVLQNKGGGFFGEFDDADTTKRPILLGTGGSGLPAIAASAVAVGDVTGDGRADIVTVLHGFLTDPVNPSQKRNVQLWQFYDQKSDGTLRRQPAELISQSEPATTAVDYASDVMLKGLNGDRIPELVFTSQFDGGVKMVRLVSFLDEMNEMAGYDFTTVDAATADNPHRLTSRDVPASDGGMEVFCANGHTDQLTRLLVYPGTAKVKPLVLVGGMATGSDPEGLANSKGIIEFNEFIGGTVSYSLNFANNTSSALTGVTLQSALPTVFELLSSDSDATVTGSGSSRIIRWTVDIPAGGSGVKKFDVRLISPKTGLKVAPKIAMKQGTKTLVSSVMPTLKVATANLFVVPNSPSQPWKFTYKPWKAPSDAVVVMQASPDGTNWQPIPAGEMTFLGEPATYALTKSGIPVGSRYFRAVLHSAAQGYEYSSVFNNFLPPTTRFGLSSKAPAKSGQLWTFNATQPGTMAYLTVRFQWTTTPNDEPSWTDLPVYSATTRKGNVWTSKTYNIPAGMVYFRAISAAPGWVDSISSFSGPWNVTPSQLILPPFKYFYVAYVGQAQTGKPATLYATTGAVPAGTSVRFQSKLSSEDDSAWTDLQSGKLTKSGSRWMLKTTGLPEGVRDFRAVCSALAYADNVSDVQSFEVLPTPVQYETLFAPFMTPLDGTVVKNGILQVRIPAYDANGIQRIYLEYANASGVFKPISGDMVESPPGSHEYVKDIVFTGTGTLSLRAVVIDGYDPSSTSWSDKCTIAVGKGGGSSPPYLGQPEPKPTPSTLKALGSVKITMKIGDDRQVYRASLQRVTAGGAFVSTVGAMVPSSSANPANFSCTDARLPDGTYYYQVVAEDYDGMQASSAVIGPFDLVTPQPPPPVANIDVAVSSRFLGPRVPTNQYNYPFLPYPKPRDVFFNYSFSSPPGGKVTFRARKIWDQNGKLIDTTKEGPPPVIWTATTTKTSGTMQFHPPFWIEDSQHKGHGEGTYQIDAFLNDSIMPIQAISNRFEVGHAWNLPDTFTKLDYGLYWFKDINDGLRCRRDQDDEYFDRSKPTVIYVHGWQPEETSKRRRESWARQDAANQELFYDCCDIWKKKGYNVGVFNWNQFGDFNEGNFPPPDKGLLLSQAAIYQVSTNAYGFTNNNTLIWAFNTFKGGYKTPDFQGRSSYATGMPGHPIEGKTVVDLFLDELRRCMAGYTTSGDEKEFRLIGHSLGTQVVGRTAKLILDYPQWQIPLPTRIALLEIAQVNIDTMNIPGLQTQWLRDLATNGVALECYQSTDLQSLLGITGAFVGPIHNMAAYACIRPDHVPSGDFATRNAKTHNDLVRWYMSSMAFPEPPAFSYRNQTTQLDRWTPPSDWNPFGFVREQNLGWALSASTPSWRVRLMMGSPFWYRQVEGTFSITVEDDIFQVCTNRN